jgi:type III restriction enzyme
MIVDEAHKVVTDLSQETLRRINPAAIIEFTATPRPNNNTLYNVRAMELKDEEMIKLPIALVEHSGWETAVDEAIQRRAELEKEAAGEDAYIRPILLFQAQSKNNEVTVEVLKKYLLETSNIPENQIKIATGEQKELDGIDIFNPGEPTRYIITVEALKEGWDCSFAYVLCSLANVQSDTSVEQLLGRIMRMPYAKTRKSQALNKAYAYVVSPHFGQAAAALVERLKNKGFDDSEALSTVQQEPPKIPDLDPNWNTPPDQYKVTVPLQAADVPPTIQFTNGDTLFFTPATTDDDIQKLCEKIPQTEAHDLVWKFDNYKKSGVAPSPASKGVPFKVPRLMFDLEGELFPAEPVTIFAAFDWNIISYSEPQLTETEFNTGDTGKGYFIDIDGNRLQYTAAAKEQFLPHLSDTDIWTPSNLCYWLDSKLKQEDIPQPQMLEWLRRHIEFLTVTRKITLSALMIAKYALLNKLFEKITAARLQAKGESFALFQREGRKTLDYENGFSFTAGMYTGLPVYRGSYRFKKHFLGPANIPAFDSGEETEFAQALDEEPQIQYWLRNAERQSASFRLPTSTDFFYPDFIAQLADNRILAAEYKGAHLADNKDTKEKANIGEVWEKLSNGKALFMIATKTKGGKPLAQQIKEKIGR